MRNGNTDEGLAATVLASTLSDSEYWVSPEEAANPATRDDLALRALGLYAESWPAYAAAYAEGNELFVKALWIIREVADRCAVLSIEWSSKEIRRWVNLPRRERLIETARRAGVDAWSASRGAPLQLKIVSVEELRPAGPRRVLKARTFRPRVAREFLEVEAAYQGLLAMWGREGSAWFRANPRIARNAAVVIAGAYNNLLWAEVTGDEVVALVSRGILLMAQGMFALSKTREATQPSIPTVEFVRSVLRCEGRKLWQDEGVDGLSGWLQGQGAATD